MIPKVIHYCWLGKNPLPPLVERCLETWHEKLPDYEIRRWDESNSDLDSDLVQSAVKNKLWAFAADYLRLKILYTHGGIYLDTDMEMVSVFTDEMLSSEVFLGYESDLYINGAVIGALPKSEFIKYCINEMELSFKNGGFETIPKILTRVYKSGIYPNVIAYPPVVFYPFNPYDENASIKQLMLCDVKKETVAIHHWYKSWSLSFWARLRKKLINVFGFSK